MLELHLHWISKSSNIFIPDQIRLDLDAIYETGFEHILVVQSNILIIPRIQILLKFRRLLLLSYNKLNLILDNNVLHYGIDSFCCDDNMVFSCLFYFVFSLLQHMSRD